jgi:Rod binding domain-containing protein
MSVPPIDPSGPSALAPAWVRNGATQVKQDYEVATGFEETLLEQLSSALTAGGLTGEEEGGEGSGDSGFSSMLPQALAQGVTSGGGLGLAAELTRDMLGASAETKASSESTSAGQRVTASGGIPS